MSKLSRLWDEAILKQKLNEHKVEAEKILSDEHKVRTFLSKLKEKLRTMPIIGAYLEDIPFLGNMVLDYVNGSYRKIPRSSIISIMAALIYFLSPIDLVPDFIFQLGLLDDAFLIKIVIDSLRHDIHGYKEWKSGKTDMDADVSGVENLPQE